MKTHRGLEGLEALMGNTIGFASIEAQIRAAEEDMVDAPKGSQDARHAAWSGCTACGARVLWSASAADTAHPVIRTEQDYIAARGRCPTCVRDDVPWIQTFDEYVRFLLAPCEPPDRKNPPKPTDLKLVCSVAFCRGESRLRRTLENTTRIDVVLASFTGTPFCVRCLWIEVLAARFNFHVAVEGASTWLDLNPHEKV